jgi:mRNA interferase YafQ
MRRLEYSTKFKKDYRRVEKRGLSMKKLNDVLELLMDNKTLPPKNRPHMLSGEWKGFSECHIEPDWLLIYDLDDPQVVALHRTGTHCLSSCNLH